MKITRRALLRVAGKEQNLLPFLALSEGEDEATVQKIFLTGFYKNEILNDSFDRKIETELENVTALEADPSSASPSRIDIYAREAATTALDLLRLCGRPAKKSRKSDWCKLAGILYGEPNKDLYQFVLEVETGSKIVAVST